MATSTASCEDGVALRVTIFELLSWALNDGIDGRNRLREPFLAQVFIHGEGDAGEKRPGFSRDISAEGIGLLHAFPIETKETLVEVTGHNRKPVKLKVEIAWCEPFGEGWYISGGRFLAVLDRPPIG